MANERKDTMEIKQILLLQSNGQSNRQIAIQVGMSSNTSIRKLITKGKEY